MNTALTKTGVLASALIAMIALTTVDAARADEAFGEPTGLEIATRSDAAQRSDTDHSVASSGATVRSSLKRTRLL